MHTLHTILVYIPDVQIDSSCSRAEKIRKIRDYADNMTEGFVDFVFDWRETGTAGRWSSSFPENVLLVSENLENAEEKLLSCSQYQKDLLEKHIRKLTEWCDEPVSQVARRLWDMEANIITECSPKDRAPFEFMEIAKQIYGVYMSDSYFYDTSEQTARITEKTLKKVKAAPQDWALVLFDYHI